MGAVGGPVVRILVMTVLTLLTIPVRILVTLWYWLSTRNRTVLAWKLGGTASPMEPARFEHCLDLLSVIAKDRRICGVRIALEGLNLGRSQLYQLHDAIRGLVAEGTPVAVHLNAFSDRELLLASAASRVSMSPPAEIILSGVAAPMRFYGGALDKLGVVVDFESAGAYKSFGEAYTRPMPTVANREAMDHLLGDLQIRWLETVAEARGLAVDALEALLKCSPISAGAAHKAGLVDAVAYNDQDWAEWDTRLGGEVRRLDFHSYGRLIRMRRRLPAIRRRRSKIAVVHLSGPIVERRAQMPRGGRMVVSDDVVPVLDALAENKAIKAVVLAVDSPGGSALASDLIARAVSALGNKKPVIAAMGNVAASGGYYLSAPAAEIWAHPATITGSIGVVGGKVVLGAALARFGVQTTWMGPSPDPGMMGSEAPFSEDQRIRFRGSLRRVYERFLQIVQTGRGMSEDEAEAVAQGRVWTGSQALENGLVDTLGSYAQAVQRVAVLAGEDPERCRVIPFRFKPPKFGAITRLLGGQASSFLPELLGAEGLLLNHLYSAPCEPLALVPVALDEEAWGAWSP